MSPSVYNQQSKVLFTLLARAKNTEIGREYSFDTVETYVQFRQRLPLFTYQKLQPVIKRLKAGDANILWPGSVRRFAVSAGTSGNGKHLPLTDERLASDHDFMRKVAVRYLCQRPNIFRLWGDHLSMPGSIEQRGGLKLGEISGFTALHVPFWLRYFQIADPAELTEISFQRKFDLLLSQALKADLRVITAVPSWMLTLFQQALAKSGASSIAEVWPRLRLLVCGGVKLANYRVHLEQLSRGLSLDFIETYGASEGYIGFTDELVHKDLRMSIANGIFFEALAEPSASTEASSRAIPLWKVKKGIPYSLLLSTNAGLWRYRLGDVVEFTCLNPLRFIVKGRINDMLDDFGEALQIYEARRALKKVCDKRGVKIDIFSIAPVMPDEGIPYHQWFIQFSVMPDKQVLKGLERQVDIAIKRINRHYAIRRETQALGEPKICAINQSQINQWKQKHGKDRAQGKLPTILPKNTLSLL